MPTRIYIKEYHQNNMHDFFWKTLCIVYDHEALGFLERLLKSNGFEIKTEKA